MACETRSDLGGSWEVGNGGYSDWKPGSGLMGFELGFDTVPSHVLRCLSDHVLPHPLLLPVRSRIDLSMLLYSAGDWPVRGLREPTE